MEMCRDKTDFHGSLYSQIPRNKSHEKPRGEAQGHKCKGGRSPERASVWFFAGKCRGIRAGKFKQI